MSFEDFQKQVTDARTDCENRRLGLKSNSQRAGGLKRKKEQLLRQVGPEGWEEDPVLAEINAAESQLAETLSAQKAAYGEALDAELALLRENFQFTDPIRMISALYDSLPILLFPLRLETRFKRVMQEGALVDQLWVRVFPDDIAVNSFESDLSEGELRDARSYWLARWKAGKEVDGNRGAWRSLASAHAPGRAYWLITGERCVPVNLAEEPEKLAGEIILAIGTETPLVEPELSAIIAYWQSVWQANQDPVRLQQAWKALLLLVEAGRAESLVKDYQPANLADLPPSGYTRETATVRVEFVIFPPTDALETRLHSWSQPPTVSILPERLVLLAYCGETAREPVIGNLVPPRLFLGPDPASEPGEDLRLATSEDAAADPAIHEGDLIFSEHLRWMFDFDEAVEKGMGFRINLAPDEASRGFDRILVLGLKMSADKDTGQGLLQNLFAQHHSSRKGLSILKQGTPTNNTEDDPSGYSWRHDPDDSFEVYFGDEAAKTDPVGWFTRTDGRWLAEFLGIDPLVLQTVENYYQTDISEAKAMQRALWPSTMGHFMHSMMNPVFSQNIIEHTREFFTRYVSGRGCLPALRVGRQPYGILPATRYTHMSWFMPQTPTSALTHGVAVINPYRAFLPALYRILMEMDLAWTLLKSRVAFAGKQGDPHQLLLDILGLHPASVEVYQRFANSLDQVHNIYNVRAYPHGGLAAVYRDHILAAAALLSRYGYTMDAEHPAPDIFKKVFFESSNKLGGMLIDRVPNSETEAVSIWTADNMKNYIGWLIEAALDSHDRLRLQNGFIEDKPPTALLYLLMHHALDLSYIDASLKLHLAHGVMTAEQFQHAYLEPDMIHIKTGQETESTWKTLYTNDVRITGDPEILVGKYIPLNIDALDEAVPFREALAGLRQLEHVPTARLERLLMEHIDTVSYRLDSWILGFLHLQLAGMRGISLDGPASPEKRGVYLGTYGWLENIRPEHKVLTPVRGLSEELREFFNPTGDLVEDNTNAGYILAPSQNHAITAAVLRNGHLSMDDPEQKEALKIKLSSERVRHALLIIEGIQGGQTLAALLGYQFERSLHDNTGAEVDEFIFELRNAFPLVAKRFKATAPGDEDPEYESIEQIEAKNVLDGVSFLEHIEKTGIRTYPFGLGLTWASTEQKDAINQAVLDLIEVNDAVADIAMAESVHQVVLGNYERASAILDTYSKGNFPPTPEVIKTPATGIQLTHRVALHLPTGLSHTLGNPGVTPRMVAEPALQDWLSRVMPALDQVECVLSYTDQTDAEHEEAVPLSELGLAHIDLLYLLNTDGDKAMSALDDRLIHHLMTDPMFSAPRLDRTIRLEYLRTINAGAISVFSLTSLVASLRAMLFKSRPLNAADVKLSNEAAKKDETSLSLDPTRLVPLVAAVNQLRLNSLNPFVTDIAADLAAGDVNLIVARLDGWVDELTAIFTQAADYGLPQTGIGFVYQWCQGLFTQFRSSVQELIDRWTNRRTEYQVLIAAYTAGIGISTDQELFTIINDAEMKISTSLTMPALATPADQFGAVEIKFGLFDSLLNNTLLPLLDLHSLTPLLQAVQAAAVQLLPFDSQGFAIDDQLVRVKALAEDLKTHAENLSREMQKREDLANALLASAAGAGDPLAKVELVKKAAKAVFGDDFVILPQFTLQAAQAAEWQNTLVASDYIQRYLLTDLAIDFPMDNWLYGISRVRDKLHHLENTLIHMEGFTGSTLKLVPSQFPYRLDDCWLGLQFPDKKPGTEEPFTINEDKLLFTGVYHQDFVSADFDPAAPQCGLLLDEWTEVIPSRDRTVGLTFHYDQPNSEPPQALLLVTPSVFTGHWRWEELVQTLHETLEMAKKRAVEPDHVDDTVYNRFLPPIVSLASPFPFTAMLNLSLNNMVALAEVIVDD